MRAALTAGRKGPCFPELKIFSDMPDIKRISLGYVAFYLLAGGIPLALDPDLALRLLLSNGHYGEVMPRLVGLVMILLGGLVSQIVRQGIASLYVTTFVLRVFMLAALLTLYFYSGDPMMLVIFVIVGVGVAATVYGLAAQRIPK